ncbi:MAG: hypothetical protein HGA44_06385 [Cellulomonadaceae bacterium]|nr:hypothetical protein [Cellulomonadaceae bacterium]
MKLTKQQKLRNTANGLLAGLVAVGFEGPWRWAHHEWETAFYKVWRAWPPAGDTQYFRSFRIGGSADGRTSQARDILFAVNGGSPFDGYDRGPLNPRPLGLSAREYLEDCVEGATPEEWMTLASALLAELKRSPQG